MRGVVSRVPPEANNVRVCMQERRCVPEATPMCAAAAGVKKNAM